MKAPTLTRLAGPGAPTVPARSKCPTATRAEVLILAVELDANGEPAWVLDSTPEYFYRSDDEPGRRRPGACLRIHPGEPERMDCGCRAGRICRKHNSLSAVRWWREAHRRDSYREWRAVGDSDHRGHVGRAGAEGRARRLGLTKVCEVDGWGRTLATLDLGGAQ